MVSDPDAVCEAREPAIVQLDPGVKELPAHVDGVADPQASLLVIAAPTALLKTADFSVNGTKSLQATSAAQAEMLTANFAAANDLETSIFHAKSWMSILMKITHRSFVDPSLEVAKTV